MEQSGFSRWTQLAASVQGFPPDWGTSLGRHDPRSYPWPRREEKPCLVPELIGMRAKETRSQCGLLEA
jgi:hypothetical protein